MLPKPPSRRSSTVGTPPGTTGLGQGAKRRGTNVERALNGALAAAVQRVPRRLDVAVITSDLTRKPSLARRGLKGLAKRAHTSMVEAATRVATTVSVQIAGQDRGVEAAGHGAATSQTAGSVRQCRSLGRYASVGPV